MRRLIPYLIVSCLLLSGCGHGKVMTVNEHDIYRFVDRTIWHDSLYILPLPQEKVKDIVPDYGLLHMETSLAVAEAHVEEDRLIGEMWNKETLPETIRWKERIVYRDSIRTVEKEIPVEVERLVTRYPKSYWVLLAYAALSMMVLARRMIW